MVGPEQGRATVIAPMELVLDNVHEIAGVGTLFPDDEGNPILHMHMACGRDSTTATGCIRQGVRVVDTTGIRTADSETGFKLLQP